MSFVLEPLISSLVENLVSIVSSFIGSKLQIGEMNQVQAQVEDWKITLEDISGFLMDAEAKKENHPAVRRWLADLEELIFDAEDLIDQFNYEILRRQLEHTEPESSCGPAFDVQILIPFTKRCSTEESWENSDLVSKLNEITGRFQRLKERKRDLNLFTMPVTSSEGLESSRCTRDPGSRLPTQPVIFGRDDCKQEIIRILKETGDPKIGVLPIVGKGGLGKTTLARYVYNDDEIKSYFDIRGWICISADYDIKRIMKDILDSISRDDIKDQALGWIQARIGERLRNKKFLFVIDDNSNENDRDWNTLKSLFDEGMSGSKIIVTTRSQNVADIVGTVPCIIPNLLSEKDCWSLFCIHANLDSNGTSFFEVVGEEISRKCSGLPLAVMTIGGMLRNKRRVEEWEDILNSMTSVSEDVMSVLRMSYNDLTSQLKLCLAFLALFPEDYEFEKDEVTLLWIAAGLIQPSETEKMSKLEVSRDCFYKLLSRSLLSPVESDFFEDCQLYVMHDLVRQVAQKVSSRNLYIHNDDDRRLISESTQHLSFNGSRFQNIMDRIIEEGQGTVLPWRTVVLVYNCRIPCHPLKDEMFLRLKFVRALSLVSLRTKELPESIGEMKLLRYLNLSGNKIEILPMSITSLHNLEMLSLSGCYSLKQLPEKIEELINLWYLDISYCCLNKLPVGIKELKQLENLTCFIVDDNLSVASLGNLKFLQGSLEISGLEKVASPEEAACALLSEKRLDELKLRWKSSRSGDDLTKMETERKILEQMQPHENLKMLTIEDYGGQMFPCWFTGSLKCLTVLKIKNCVTCSESFTPNLVSLKELSIEDCYNMEVHLPRMPNLESLCIINCSHVACTDTFSTAALETVQIYKCAMSELFMEKVRLGFPDAGYLCVPRDRHVWKQRAYVCWSFPDLSMIADNYDKELKVKELYVNPETTIEHLPVWICKAKSLRKIEVGRCSALKQLFASADIPSSLTQIEVYDCCELKSLLSQDPLLNPCYPLFTGLLSLKELRIRNCSKMEVHLARMPNLKTLFLENCSYVGCADTFSTVALDALTLKRVRMSELFKEKVRLGFPNIRYLDTLSIPDIIPDNYDEEMKVEELCVTDDCSIEHLPPWVCKAKSLSTIKVKKCPSLMILIPYKDIPSCLRSIEIYGCPQLTSILPQESLPQLTKSLSIVHVECCPSLKVLLPAQSTRVVDCSSLESFHEGGLQPHSITFLVIKNCPLISQKLRHGDEHLWSMISPWARIRIDDGEELNRI